MSLKIRVFTYILNKWDLKYKKNCCAVHGSTYGESKPKRYSQCLVLLPSEKYKRTQRSLGLRPVDFFFFFFFEILSKRWNQSLRTDWDCMASLKCRTPCRKKQTWLPTKTPPRKTRPKTTWIKAKSLQVRRPPCYLRSREKEKWRRNSWRKGRNRGQSTM